MHKLSKNPKIVLLANGYVGLAIARYLKQKGERVVALVLHSKKDAKLSSEIKDIFPEAKIFIADKIRNANTIKTLAKLNPEIGISAWFGYILKKEFINLFPAGIINFHNSYLPVNRGKYPHVWAIAKNTVYGVTLHYVDEGIDTGDIVARKKMKVLADDTGGSLYERALNEMIDLFQMTWPKLKNNKIKPIKQSDGVHHFAKNVAELDFIDINKKHHGEDLINQIRSRSFRDRSYAYYVKNKKKIYIKIELSDKPDFKK